MRIDQIQHIYSQPLDIRLGKLRIQRLSLNRHQPEAHWIEQHSHRYSQFLVYLHGRGIHQVEATNKPLAPGSVFYLPPGTAHAFVDTGGQRPLCLAIDYRNPGSVGKHPAIAQQLTQLQMQKIRQALASLRRWHPEEASVEPGEAAAVLQIMDVLLRVSRELQSHAVDRSNLPIVRKVRSIAQQSDTVTVGEIASRLGYNRDHLNRLLKEAAGLTIGQLRDEVRVTRASAHLRQAGTIAEAAMESGFDDVNYFSRWFRKQTGLTPSNYRKQHGGK